MSFKKLSPETIEAIVGIGKAMGAVSIASHGRMVCDHCKDEDREAFPYFATDENGRVWRHLCNTCFDILNCAMPETKLEDFMDREELKELKERWMAGAKDIAGLMAAVLQQEYRIHEGKWWLVSSGKLQRPLTLDEVIWNAKQDGLLPDRLCIIGGTIAEARDFAKRHDIPREAANLVNGSEIYNRLRGTMNATVILCGRYYEVVNNRSIDYLQTNRCAVIYKAE